MWVFERRRLEAERDELREERNAARAEVHKLDAAIGDLHAVIQERNEARDQMHQLDAENRQLKAQLAAMRSAEEPGQDPEYVVRYKRWDTQNAAARKETVGQLDARLAARKNRIALEMAQHLYRFAKPRAELWANMPWSPLNPSCQHQWEEFTVPTGGPQPFGREEYRVITKCVRCWREK